MNRNESNAAYDKLIEEGRRRVGPPPTVDELLAYSRGDLAADHHDRVQELLVYYPDLARAVSALKHDSDAEPANPADITNETAAAHWESLRHRIASMRSGTTGKFKPLRAPRRGVNQRWRSMAIAASLAVVAMGSMLLYERRETPRVPPEAQLLMPDGSRGPVTELVPTPLSTHSDAYLLVAPLINQPHYADYRLEIADLGTQPPRVLWREDGVQRRVNDTFEVLIPRAFLKPGKYQLEVDGLNGKAADRLVTYTFRVTPQTD
jgi:hypothetical protein